MHRYIRNAIGSVSSLPLPYYINVIGYNVTSATSNTMLFIGVIGLYITTTIPFQNIIDIDKPQTTAINIDHHHNHYHSCAHKTNKNRGEKWNRVKILITTRKTLDRTKLWPIIQLDTWMMGIAGIACHRHVGLSKSHNWLYFKWAIRTFKWASADDGFHLYWLV